MGSLRLIQDAFAAGVAHGRKLDGCAPDSSYTDPAQATAFAYGYAEGAGRAAALAARVRKYRARRRYPRAGRAEHKGEMN